MFLIYQAHAQTTPLPLSESDLDRLGHVSRYFNKRLTSQNLRDNHSEFWWIFYDGMGSLDAWKCWFEKLTRKKKMHMTWHWDSLRHITSTILSRKHFISHLCKQSSEAQKLAPKLLLIQYFKKLKRLIKSPIIYLVLIKLKVHLMVSITAHWKGNGLEK